MRCLKFLVSTLTISFLLAGISSCKHEDTELPQTTLLTYTSIQSYVVFITDENGDILDTQQVPANYTTVFKTTKKLVSDRINITFFKQEPIFNSTELISYLGIPINETWKGHWMDSGVVGGGDRTIAITNWQGNIEDFNLSNNQESGSFQRTLNGGTLSTNNFRMAGSPYFYANTHRNNAPVYFKGTFPNLETSTSFDFSDFTPVDNVFDFAFPGNSTLYLFINGLSKSDPNVLVYQNQNDVIYKPGYLHSYGFNTGSTTGGSVKVGYNNGSDIYTTSVLLQSPRIEKTFKKVGSPTTQMPLLDYTVGVGTDKVTTFTFSVSGSYHMRESFWTVDNAPKYQSWRVFSGPEGKQVLPKLPTEITNFYTMVPPEFMSYKSSIFYKYLDGFTYTDYISSVMKTESAKTLFSKEYQSIKFIK